MKIHSGDTVKIITGKYRDKQGEVKKAIPTEGKVVVEGVNVVKRHMKSRQGVRQGGIVELEKPIDVSNVMLVCPKCGEAVRVGHRFENGEKVRVCKNPSCAATIPENGRKASSQPRDRE